MRASIIIILTILYLGFTHSLHAEVFMKRNEALQTVFPNATDIERNEIFFTPEESKTIESIAKAKNDTKLYIIYEAKDGDNIIGYAIIDTHTLRTRSETVMFVINPDGSLRQTEVLAFFEPPDYQAGDKWMQLFEGKTTDNTLKVGRDIPNMSGATITAVALAQATRKILAVYKVASEKGMLN
ncbi:MAG: FMN-binding protein [Thermodesulfobacteriota bacterium]